MIQREAVVLLTLVGLSFCGLILVYSDVVNKSHAAHVNKHRSACYYLASEETVLKMGLDMYHSPGHMTFFASNVSIVDGVRRGEQAVDRLLIHKQDVVGEMTDEWTQRGICVEFTPTECTWIKIGNMVENHDTILLQRKLTLEQDDGWRRFAEASFQVVRVRSHVPVEKQDDSLIATGIYFYTKEVKRYNDYETQWRIGNGQMFADKQQTYCFSSKDKSGTDIWTPVQNTKCSKKSQMVATLQLSNRRIFMADQIVVAPQLCLKIHASLTAIQVGELVRLVFACE